MNRKPPTLSCWFWTPAAAGLLMLGLAAVGPGCGKPASPAASPSPATPDGPLVLAPAALENLGVELATVGPVELRDHIILQGEIALKPDAVAVVTARVSGVVGEIRAGMETEVDPGEILALLSSQELSDRIMGYVETEHAFRAAMKQRDREQRLFEEDVSSEEQLVAVEGNYNQAESAHAVALQRLRLLGYEEKDLHQYMERPDLQDLTVYRLTAPIAGRVIERSLQIGQAVEAGAPVFRIADLSALQARFSLPMRYLGSVETGLEIQIQNKLLGLADRGTIQVIQSNMDPRTRTVAVVATLPNTGLRWRPGMPAQIEIQGMPTPVDRGVPKESVQSLDGRDVVFIRDEAGGFRAVGVRLGREDARFVELLEGPEPGVAVASKNSFLVLSAWENRE